MTSRTENVYQRMGYKNRTEYLETLAEEYGAPLATVQALADLLGPGEDFDGLVSSLEDLLSVDGQFPEDCL